ncbi:MAG: S9 family peptidase [Verrucomicrobia bacterium]|nr:S9 family peptidase [Verrucomicrobiota bacterium]
MRLFGFENQLHGWLGCCALLLGPATSLMAAERADAIDETVAEYFRPYQHDLARLSPDGRHIAMSEHHKDGAATIVVLDLDVLMTERFLVGRAEDHAIQQILWTSSKHLAFSTRGRAVGAIELGRSEVKPLLVGKDFDGYRPEPMIGARSPSISSRPDLPAQPVAVNVEELGRYRGISLSQALQEAKITGDLFGRDSKRGVGRALRPFLLGPKPGSETVVLLELRSDDDIYSYGRTERRHLLVPGNVIITDFHSPPEAVGSPAGSGIRSSSYASYEIVYQPAPHVVLELDLVVGRTKEIIYEEGWRRTWLDQKGHVRLALEQRGKIHRYLYRADGAKNWVPLDSIVKSSTPLGFAIGADNLLGARSVPLGFDAAGRILYLASNVGRDTYAMRALDLAKGELTQLELSHDRYDFIEPTAITAVDTLNFDPETGVLAGVRFASAVRTTKWFDPDAAAVQTALSKKLAPQRCEVREWNRQRTRFLVDIRSPGAPGGFYVAEPSTGKLIECGDRAPWLAGEKLQPVREFELRAGDGQQLSGILTLPRLPRLKPAPVLVYFHDGPWFFDSPVFNRGAQALAALGFAVVQLNHRGSAGFGRAHLAAGKTGLDHTVLEDVRAMLASLEAGKLPINPRMVAALGNGIGGYLAVRMAQLAPETFRCAVAINAPGDLEAWLAHPDTIPTLLADQRTVFFGTNRERLRAHSAIVPAPTTKTPVLVVHATENAYVPLSLGRQLYHALKKGSAETALLELPGEGHGGWSEETTARLFAELGRFFNATIYNYRVDVRTPQVVK